MIYFIVSLISSDHVIFHFHMYKGKLKHCPRLFKGIKYPDCPWIPSKRLKDTLFNNLIWNVSMKSHLILITSAKHHIAQFNRCVTKQGNLKCQLFILANYLYHVYTLKSERRKFIHIFIQLSVQQIIYHDSLKNIIPLKILLFFCPLYI